MPLDVFHNKITCFDDIVYNSSFFSVDLDMYHDGNDKSELETVCYLWKKIRGKTSNLLPDQCRKTLGQLYLFCTKFKTILDKDLNLMPVNLKIDQLESGFGMEERTLKTLFSHLSRLPLHEIMRDMGKNENLSASNPPAQDS